jgi:hypothetical protein
MLRLAAAEPKPVLGSALDAKTLAARTTNVWYRWNGCSFVQQEFAGDKVVALMLKPVTEGAPDATAPSHGFDAKEYGTNAPMLHVTTQSAASSVANVTFFYRYSADNAPWGGWRQYGASDTVAPFATSFNFPNGVGYCEFYSVGGRRSRQCGKCARVCTNGGALSCPGGHGTSGNVPER